MSRSLRLGQVGAWMLGVAVVACSGSNSSSFGDGGADTSGNNGGTAGTAGTAGNGGGGDGGLLNGGGNGGDSGLPDGSVVTTTTIYANTDDSLYSMDAQSKSVTLIGKFAGTSGSSTDGNVTDVAVNAAGDIYANTESVVYKATLPAGGSGTVQLTQVAKISAASGQKFYALAFAPAGVLGSGEALVGGDGNGELWSIDPSSGATKDLGNFGNDSSVSGGGNVFALSGDVVFYLDANKKPTGLATIRSCKKGTSTCVKPANDYLCGIDMTALATAFTSGQPAASLNAGIYGGSSSSKGNGIQFGDVYGLGAWQGNVYGFSRNISGSTGGLATPPSLLSIDTTSGVGTTVGGSSFSFTNGWSGAGVTTSVTINVPPPPPPPK